MTEGVPAKLTIVALAWNETEHLRGCFASLKLLIHLTGAETLVLFDSAGDDATLSVAREVADRVVIADFDNFARQRNRALDATRSKWVFFIDADERCTPKLAQEIAQAMDNPQYAAYQVPRRNILFGHEVRHTGWSPDYQLRLLERERCLYDESRLVHELPTVQGEIGTLKSRLVHYNYDTWGQFIAKQSAYSQLEAQTLYASGRRASVKSVLGQPLRVLKRRFIDYKGYRDGILGAALSIAMALHAAQTYLKLWSLQHSRKR
jgi:glycosyltransferase involved in cell wall biosynthesis